MTEQWRPIPEWEGFYEVSDHGRVRSLPLGNIIKPRVAQYEQISVHRARGRGRWKVHKLVALVFIGPPTGPVVRHLDDDPRNNHVSNLAYGTLSDNSRDCVRNGHHVNQNTKKTHCKRGHPLTPDNLYAMSNGARKCAACSREWQAAHTELNREAINDRRRANRAAAKHQLNLTY